jgi:ketosteroid isomerase-like protein
LPVGPGQHGDGDIEERTRSAIRRFYEAYRDGDVDRMTAGLASDVRLRFLGLADVRGVHAARRFLHEHAKTRRDGGFRIAKLVLEGNRAAAVWEERGPAANHGVGVFEVRDGLIVSIHENDAVRIGGDGALRAG